MRLEWLEDLLAVAETGSFSEAAERRRLTQSAFSRRIRCIETYVGVELFDRTRKPVQLQRTTSEQRDQILRTVQALRQLVDDLRSGSRRTDTRVVLASQHALTTARTPELVQRIQAAHEHIHVRLRSANLDECFALLFARRADIAIVYRLESEDDRVEADYVEALDIDTDRLIPVCACDGKARMGALTDTGALPIVAYPDEVFLGSVMNRIILPQIPDGLHAVPKVETALTLAALELASVGIGTAWVPASLARERIAAGRLCDLSQQLPSCALVVTVSRLRGQVRDVAALVWEHLARRNGTTGADTAGMGDAPARARSSGTTAAG